ncbi:holo-ACP synthase [Lactobacillus acetotolerans]|jgi:holo-[acyl-carrier protein] synthase|uniref:Holo-[acyl-carrier-protein] synthase n=1 Tax=Lactobacillus acetotolerans TaxID=1600 RepID=A0A5P5ZHK3_9LACO|nr:holo-ACP synthase [Lactobacillus acetotolerans]KRN40780.1 holo-acyl-carrier protein [Lactobacillus acetotolerans DSM 20749 = JCM 3825]QFG50828.1 holo-ACP synthase [Lactobacillus acetotolerans]QJD72571.1 holo-ACP synthase [Lactobacillus acetotolerans]GGV14135.1 holo-[acyl-carrier-protein] synthase [Lactobacillus acetotolerans DSM 20749 = JCM 3825]HBQ43915.1 holo-ACP synthase [Lactobacillus acetotolerans]
MIKGVGVDAVEVARVKKIVDHGDNFAKKVLTPNEFAQYQKMVGKRKVEYLGGRFSLKESFSKAMGTGLGKYVGLQDVETLWDKLGHPVMTSTKFDGNIFPSITHDDHEIVTLVVLEEKE